MSTKKRPKIPIVEAMPFLFIPFLFVTLGKPVMEWRKKLGIDRRRIWSMINTGRHVSIEEVLPLCRKLGMKDLDTVDMIAKYFIHCRKFEKK